MSVEITNIWEACIVAIAFGCAWGLGSAIGEDFVALYRRRNRRPKERS